MEPPVIPLGLEYAASTIEDAGHDVEVFDACFADCPVDKTAAVAASGDFDLAMLSVRNIDTAQAARFRNFLPEIKDYVAALHECGLPVALGGCGFSCAPAQVLEYTGADYGVAGPSDNALPALCREIENAPGGVPPPGSIFDGWKAGINPAFIPRRAEKIDYRRYIENGGVAGFVTHYGCSHNCLYCIEAGTPVHLRDPGAVVTEIAAVAAGGFHDFHLCDAEFNHDTGYCENFLERLASAATGIRWALYATPAPFTAATLDGLARTGAYLVTFSVESSAADAPGGFYCWDDIQFVCDGCRQRGIRVAIDLSVGVPGEPDDSVFRALDFFTECRPDKVNVNSWYRIYPGTGLDMLLEGRAGTGRITEIAAGGKLAGGLFYNHFDIERIREHVGADPVFKMEGFDPGTNYELLR